MPSRTPRSECISIQKRPSVPQTIAAPYAPSKRREAESDARTVRIPAVKLTRPAPWLHQRYHTIFRLPSAPCGERDQLAPGSALILRFGTRQLRRKAPRCETADSQISASAGRGRGDGRTLGDLFVQRSQHRGVVLLPLNMLYPLLHVRHDERSPAPDTTGRVGKLI